MTKASLYFEYILWGLVYYTDVDGARDVDTQRSILAYLVTYGVVS